MPLEENTFTVLRCPAVTISLHWSFRFILIYSYMSLVTSRTVSPKFLSIFSFVFFFHYVLKIVNVSVCVCP